MMLKDSRKRLAAGWVAAGLVLALGACSRTDAPGGQAGDPSASSQAFPWSDRLDPPSADPSADPRAAPAPAARSLPSPRP